MDCRRTVAAPMPSPRGSPARRVASGGDGTMADRRAEKSCRTQRFVTVFRKTSGDASVDLNVCVSKPLV